MPDRGGGGRKSGEQDARRSGAVVPEPAESSVRESPSSGEARPLMSRRVLAAIALAGLVVALVPRLAALRGTDFPLVDGGLFSVMVDELVTDSFVPPVVTSYNRAGIPWAYPPFAFYVAAGLVKLSGVKTTTLVHWLPLLINLVTVLVFPWSFALLFRRRSSLLIATITFAILPFSFNWQIKGGGLTRAPGMLFCVLAVGAGLRTVRSGERRAAVLAALFLAAAVLFHPGMPAVCGTYLTILWLVEGRSVEKLRVGALIAGSAVILSAPWWLTVVVRYGPGTLLAAGQAMKWSIAELAPLPLLSFTGDRYGASLAVLAVIGVAFEVSQRRALLPIWLLAAFSLPWMDFSAATVPAALLVGIGLGELVLPALTKGAEGDRARLTRVAAIGLTVLLLGNALVFTSVFSAPADPAVKTLTRAERDAMAWVAANTSHDASFLVVSSADGWAEDPVSEWFPALAKRPSVVTPQGCEWLGGEFQRRAAAYDALTFCRSRGLPCLAQWSRERGVAFTHVFVSKVPRGPSPSTRLLVDLKSSSRFVLVYENQAAVVLALRKGGEL